MTEHLSVAEFRRLGAKRAKFGSSATMVEGIRFDSKLEAARYRILKNYAAVKLLKWFVRQVPFDLPGGIKYRADFLVVWTTPDDYVRPAGELVTVEDCKGYMTRLSQTKIVQVEAIYKIKVKIITKENIDGR